MPKPSPKTVPVLTTDAEAEAFLDQDLSDLDFTRFTPLRLKTLPRSARVTMRLPDP